MFSFAQLTLTNVHHALEITGLLSTYYNDRVLKSGEVDEKKDRFKLRDAIIQLEGRIGNLWEYELQADFADLAANSANVLPDPENLGIMDAYIRYKGISNTEITFGYQRLPYGRSSLMPFAFSPYWQRVEYTRGDLFSRRDVGLTLNRSFWNERINVYAGVYTGLGELSLIGDNDPSGKLEYIGRAEFAFPSKQKIRDIDVNLTPEPTFMIGANARYTNKRLPLGEDFPQFARGEYGIKVVNGEKFT